MQTRISRAPSRNSAYAASADSLNPSPGSVVHLAKSGSSYRVQVNCRKCLRWTGFAGQWLKADLEAWADELAKRTLWETTPADDPDASERWSEDGAAGGGRARRSRAAFPLRRGVWMTDLD